MRWGTIVFSKLVRPVKCLMNKPELPFQPKIITIVYAKSPSVIRGKLSKRGGS